MQPGNCSALININSSSSGTQATLNIPSGNPTLAYVNLKDMKAQGGATFTANSVIDLGNNSGWTLSPLASNNYYWVGGSGNWGSQLNWSTTSGGSPSGCAPTPADNVIFDANSFSAPSQTVTIDVATPTCKNMTWTDLANATPIFNSNNKTLNIYGSLTVSPNMSFSQNPSINFLANTTGQTITFSGKTLGNLEFRGIGGGWTFQDRPRTGSVSLNNGALSTNNLICDFGSLSSESGNLRSLDLGTSTLNISGGLYITNTSNLTFLGNAATVNITGGGALSTIGLRFDAINFTSPQEGYDLNYGPYIANTITFNHNCRYFRGNNTIGTLTVNGNFSGMEGSSTITTANFNGASSFLRSNTFGTLNLTGPAGTTYTFGSGTTQTINTALKVANGNGSFPVYLKSNSTGNQAFISMPTGSVCADFVRIQDINASGGASFTAGPNSQNISNNTGWTFLSSNTPFPSVTISAENGVNSLCGPGNTILFFNGNAIGSWASSNTNVATINSNGLLTSTALAGTTEVSFSVTSNFGCIYKDTKLVTIKNTAAPIVSPQLFCFSALASNLSGTGTAIKWYATSNGSALDNNTPLSTATYFASQTQNNCESPKTEFAVTIQNTAAPLANTTQAFFTGAKIRDIVIQGTDIRWYASEADALSNSNVLNPETLLIAGTTYYATQTVSLCRSTSATAVTVNFNLAAVGFDKSEFKYYPNPVSDKLIISNGFEIETIRTLNIVGQALLEVHPNSKNAELDMRNLPTGIYILEVKVNSQTQTFKVVKK